MTGQMSRTWTGRAPRVILASVLSWLGAVAALSVSSEALARRLRDPGYARRTSKQKAVVERHVHRVVSPTLTFPALVEPGARFEMLVRVSRAPTGELTLPRDEHAWRIYLVARSGEHRRAYRGQLRAWKRRGGLLRLKVEVPADLARDVYDVRLMAPGIDELQPNAVRVLGRSERSKRFRFAVLSDHQLWDPSHRFNGRQKNAEAYPLPSDKTQHNVVITRQGFHELRLLDPDFVLYTGDLIFGLDYPAEYRQMRRLLVDARLPIFAVPGNHDGYAVYNVRLRKSAVGLVAGALGCHKHLKKDLSWGALWVFISCVYGDVSEQLYAELLHDGLTYWRRQLGPMDYSFRRGGLYFIGINTYAGTPERRHAFSIYMDALDLHLGAPAVDNYGGYLTAEQLRFVERELERARRAGLTPVVFGHHDPRGNGAGNRYHANDPFPSDPVGLDHFEEWNFDGARWDSDPDDDRRRESVKDNSARALLALLARHGGYYLSGHVHRDGGKVYRAGSDLHGFRVAHRLEFIRTTTAAAGVREGGYWGYRLIEARGGRLHGVDYAPKLALRSLPAGNLWVAPRTKSKGALERELVSGLPRATPVVVRWRLPRRAEGYRFRLRPAPNSSTSFDPKQHAEVRQLVDAGGEVIYWVRAVLPAARWPPRRRGLQRLILRALPARGNQAPLARIELVTGAGVRVQPVGDAFDAAPGQELVFLAGGVHDEEGDRVARYRWQVGERRALGERVVHTFSSAGLYRVRLTLLEQTGARRVIERIVRVQVPRAPDGCHGCRAVDDDRGLLVPGALLLMLAALHRGRGGRRRPRRRFR